MQFKKLEIIDDKQLNKQADIKIEKQEDKFENTDFLNVKKINLNEDELKNNQIKEVKEKKIKNQAGKKSKSKSKPKDLNPGIENLKKFKASQIDDSLLNSPHKEISNGEERKSKKKKESKTSISINNDKYEIFNLEVNVNPTHKVHKIKSLKQQNQLSEDSEITSKMYIF